MAGYSVTFTVVDQATAQIEAINRRLRRMQEPMERMSRQLRQFIDLSGLKKVAEGFTEIGRRARESLEVLTRLVPVMGALTGAASLAGIARLTQSWADWGNQLVADATRIGSTTDELEQLQIAIDLAGGSTSDMTQSLKGLTQAAYGAFTGRDPTAVAWFRKAGINIRDANGHLRTAAQLLPEVTRYIESLKDPTDRLTAAQGLGSAALAKLTEELQRSGRTLPEWLAEAQKIPKMTEDQVKALTRYNQAIGQLDAVFSSLKNQIGATLAEALTPLIAQFATFVQKNEPEIIRAVRELVTEFANWLRGIDWKSVGEGAKSIGNALLAVARNLDQVKVAAEIVAGVFAVKWAVGIVSSIATVVTVLGPASPLLLALGAIAAISIEIYNHWGEITKAAKDLGQSFSDAIERIKKSWTDFWAGRDPAGTAPYSNLPPGAGPPRPSGAPFAPFGGVATPGAARGAPDLVLPDIDVTAPPPRPGVRGGPPAGLVPAVPGRIGATAGPMIDYFVSRGWTRAQAAGIVANLQSESGLDPTRLGDKGLAYGLGQWHPDRQANFARVMGHDIRNSTLGEQLAFVDWELRNTEAAAGARLHQAQRPGEAGTVVSQYYERPRDVAGNIAARSALAERMALQVPQGAPVQVTGGQSVSGKVDVAITHKNPPPGTRITATGIGDVAVAQPRVEYSQLAVI
jgi:hypothetical protein